MNSIAEVLQHIGSTSSRDMKLSILKQYEELPGLKEVLRFIYNPYQKTGISDNKLHEISLLTSVPAPLGEIGYKEAIEYFTKHTTGRMEDLVFARQFVDATERKYGKVATGLAYAIVSQNLKIGITAASLNKVYGADFIPKIGCMLGTPFDSLGSDKIAWPCIITEKLDGVRRILIKENNVCRMYSRSGHEDTGLIEILEEAQYLPDNYVYDGELLAEGTYTNSIALRQATNSLANCKGNRTGLIFNVFDMVPTDEFFSGASSETAFIRKVLLGATLMDDSISLIDKQWWPRIQSFGIHKDLTKIKPVPILGCVNNLTEAEPIVEEIWRRGGEGIMLNTYNGLYEIKRSKHLIKVKHVEEFVLPVVDLVEGTGKYEDMLGCLVVMYKGSYVGVGSGLTDTQRQDIWDNQSEYLNRKIEIESFGESINAQGYVSLNCPIFKRFVGDE